MTATAILALARADARTIARDPLLSWIILFPVGVALLLRILVPRIETSLWSAAGFALAPFHPLIMSGYFMTASGLVGMVIGFLLLDERDARTLHALRVTPVGLRRYLAYRIALPLLLGIAATLVGYPLAGLSPLPVGRLLPIAIVAGIAAPILALVLAVTAPNKVAGFAVMKVVNGVNVLPVVAFFVPRPLQYVAGVLPTYWPMRALWSAVAGDKYGTYLGVGLVVGALSLVWMARLFDRRLRRV
jgi:fluoroquinolone transport system permease protein